MYNSLICINLTVQIDEKVDKEKAGSEKKYIIVDAVLEVRTQALANSFLAYVDKYVNWLNLRTLINKKYTQSVVFAMLSQNWV